MRKRQMYMNKPIYFGLSISELIKISMYEFWYNFVKPKHGEKAKLCCMDKDNFIVLTKTDDICKCIAKGVETRFNTSNFELKRRLIEGKSKKVIGLMKDKLSQKIMKKNCWINSKNQ